VIMKHVVSISLGSRERDNQMELEIFGETILIERIGTDGDMDKAANMFRDLDGKVDAFGLGGADLGMTVNERYYPFYSTGKLVRHIHKTPVVDGLGLKSTLERKVTGFLELNLASHLDTFGRKAFFSTGTDRWGLCQPFATTGYECIFGDLMFVLGIPVPIRSVETLLATKIAAPVVTRLPFKWLYPLSTKTEIHIPRFKKYYQWATVIAGDCIYLKRYLPKELLSGKIIVTNTTTPDDTDLFRQAGVQYLVTTTPVFNGRSFGTNVIEAVLIAISGQNRKLTRDELFRMLNQTGIGPQLQKLN
jgi:hypothetical protein